jgi:hypothetical protein
LPIGVPGPIRVSNSLSSRESIRFRPGRVPRYHLIS